MAANGDAFSGTNPPEHIFAGVAFTIIESPDLQEEAVSKLRNQLIDHGATHCLPSSSDIQNVTHIIATTIDFPAYNDAIDGYINVVKPIWVEHSISKKRTSNPRQYSPDPCLYLSDVVITCAEDIPQGDRDAIIGGVYAAGGQYSPALSKLITHVVALSMEAPQCRLVLEKNLKCLPVLPHWFDDCLKLGKKIDSKPYLLPNPQILNAQLRSPVKWRVSDDVSGASTPIPEETQLQYSPSKSRRDFNVFKNKTIYLDEDLKLAAHLESTIKNILKNGGATVVQDVRHANVLICRFRSSDAYKTASRAGLDVGNLSWLYYIINRNTYTSPTRRLLHYPIPLNGIPGFKPFVISVSNYTGEARIYLESLVRAAGGRFTKTMTQANTHLITAHQASEKCDAAKEWGINIVNHLWLEESYAKCKIQPLTNSRYTHFPHRTNLGEVLGQTQVDRDIIEQLSYPMLESPNGLTNGHLETLHPNTADWRSTRPLKDPRTPGVPRSLEEKENQSPMTSGRRAAKQRAAEKLRNQATDIALFEKESKRVGGVVYGGRKVTDPDRIAISPAATAKKRYSNGEEVTTSNEPSIAGHSENDEDVQKISRKKPKRAEAVEPGIQHDLPLKVLVTGYQRWSRHGTETGDKAKLKALGITVVDIVGKHTILAAPKMLRTRKFVAGIAGARDVVDVSWLEKCIKRGEILPRSDFRLKDLDWEANNSTTMSQVMARAEAHRHDEGLLKDWTVFCTEGVHGGCEPYMEIVRANKGNIMTWKGRDTQIKRCNGDKTRDGEAKRDVFLVSDESDSAIWPKFRTNAAMQGWRPRIVKPDWLLTIATCQNVDLWDDNWLLWNEDAMETAG